MPLSRCEIRQGLRVIRKEAADPSKKEYIGRTGYVLIDYLNRTSGTITVCYDADKEKGLSSDVDFYCNPEEFEKLKIAVRET